MPAINPNNYNIDNLNSQLLGPISATDFRTYVLNHNLSDVNPEIQTYGYTFSPRGVYAGDLWNPINTVQDIPNLSNVSFIPSDHNNSTAPRPDNIGKNLWSHSNPFYGSESSEDTFSVEAKSLTDPGTVDMWMGGSGFETEVSTIRNMLNLSKNDYGPEFTYAYNDPNNPLEATGYKQYPTDSGGDVLGPIIAKTLGFSPTNGIDFPSGLQDVAQERRIVELKNRVKLNFVEDTIGKINLDPLGLLSGQKLFTPNYAITRPKSFLGKAAEFTANLAGFNVPTSIIPGDINTKIGSNAFQDDLLDYTGKGQRDLMYANVYSSKYSPDTLVPEDDIDDSKLLGKVGKFFDGLGKKKGGDNYLKINKKEDEDTEKKSLAQKVGNFVNGLITPQGNEQLIPTTEDDVNPSDPLVNMGIDGKYNAIEGMDNETRFNNLELDAPNDTPKGASIDHRPNNTTLIPSILDSDDPNSSFTHQTPSANRVFDWRNRDKSVANRGLLKYTQDMINNAESNGHRGGAKYIGRFNSNSNLIQINKDIGEGQTISVPKHKDVSMGNLVRGADDDFYCRSWSARNPYQNHYDLIRRDKLYRSKFINDLSVLEDNGHVKIAPYDTDSFERNKLGDGQSTMYTSGNDIKKYMFSLENLAWLDAPQKIGLPNCELGANGGRVMWFPPYDISFTDNTSVNWEQNNFIGRGEPIYTYNNTDRKGTLSFSIIVDHPSVINQMKDESEDTLYKFFAGCGVDIKDFFEDEVIKEVEEEIIKEVAVVEETNEVTPTITDDPVIEEQIVRDPPSKELTCYFRNARRSKLVGGVRAGDGRDIEEELLVGYELDGNQPHSSDGGILNLNEEFNSKIDALIDFLATKDGQGWVVEFIGYTSGAAPNNYNKILSIDRAESVYKYVTQRVKDIGINNGTDTGSTYTFNANNFGKGSIGYRCASSPSDCKSATENSQLDINDLKITVGLPFDVTSPNGSTPFFKPKEMSKLGRWIINAKGEDGADSENDEDADYGNNDEDREKDKRDRKVTIKLDYNHEYLTNTVVAKLEPKKAELLPVRDLTPLVPVGLPSQQPIVTYVNEQPVTSKLGTEPTLLVVDVKEKAELIQGKELNGETGDLVDDEIIKTKEEKIRKTIKKTVQKLFTECSYFEKIKKEDPFVYETINQKIKHFHPAFHSMTPEGFNSRLTFLHQCTRQGPNIKERAGQTQNMAFGRPPICILRIGDFYYTKIVIDSLNITYEPLQWDLNPEGVGVQPTIAKIDLNFSFIGGSSIAGPIRQLQNAVSANFFANTSVFNPRRYYDSTSTKYTTLEEMLAHAAENGKIETNGSSVIGFGSFKSQGHADSEINKNVRVSTDNDNIEQTEDVQEVNASGEVLPTLTEEQQNRVNEAIAIGGYPAGAILTTELLAENLAKDNPDATPPSDFQVGGSDMPLLESREPAIEPGRGKVNSVISLTSNGDWGVVTYKYSVIVRDSDGTRIGYWSPPEPSVYKDLIVFNGEAIPLLVFKVETIDIYIDNHTSLPPRVGNSEFIDDSGFQLYDFVTSGEITEGDLKNSVSEFIFEISLIELEFSDDTGEYIKKEGGRTTNTEYSIKWTYQ